MKEPQDFHVNWPKLFRIKLIKLFMQIVFGGTDAKGEISFKKMRNLLWVSYNWILLIHGIAWGEFMIKLMLFNGSESLCI